MSRTRTALVLAGLLAALLVLAACGGGDDSGAAPETVTEEAAPEPAPPAEPPAEPEEPPPPAAETPEEAPAEPPEAPPEEAETPAEPPAEAAEPAAVGTTIDVVHGPVTGAGDVAEAVLCIDIERNPPQEGQTFEVTITNVDNGVVLSPIMGEFGSSGRAAVRTNVSGVATFAVVVDVDQDSEQQDIEIVPGAGDDDCGFG